MPPGKRLQGAPAKKVDRQAATKEILEAAETGRPPGMRATKATTPRKTALKLNKGSMVHTGILDLKENVAYCRVVFAGNNYGYRSGADLGIIEVDRFVTWMNEKNGKHNGGERFVKIDVVGADTDQRENAGINKLYEEFFKENEDVRITASLALMFADEGGCGTIVVTKYKDGWRLNNSTEDKGVSGRWHIVRIVEDTQVPFVKAREVFLERLHQEIGEEMFSKLRFPSEEWAREIDEQRAARNAARG